jgi:hypothetical protein
MKKNLLGLAAVACLACQAAFSAPQAQVSEKQALAVFALGYYGYNIPQEALGGIDAQIINVFTQMKRFEIIGFEQRFAASDVGKFISDLKKFKEANMTLPDEYALGEAFLTEAELSRLVGSFYIVMPVVTNFEVKYYPAKSDKSGVTIKAHWDCSIDVSFTFQDVAASVTMAAPILKGSGSSTENSNKAVLSAIDSIPGSLELEARKIFPLDSKIVSANLTDVKMRLGSNMGIKKGYEFAVIKKEEIDGVTDESEAGLVVVRKVTSEFSEGTILFSSIPLGKETQLREVPRAGVDISLYSSFLYGSLITSPSEASSASRAGLTAAPGLKITLSEGLYEAKPFVGLQTYMPGIDVDFFPMSAYLGGEFNLYLRRLQISPFAAAGLSLYYYDPLDGLDNGETTLGFGGLAGLGLSYLANKNLKIYAEASGQLWLAAESNIGDLAGVGGTIGMTTKF